MRPRHSLCTGPWFWETDSESDTGEIVFLSDTEAQSIVDSRRRPTITSDLVLHKKRDDSSDSSFIEYIDLQDWQIKRWSGNSGYEDGLSINYDGSAGATSLACADNTGKCSPLIDGLNQVVLIKLRFNPRAGSASGNQWTRNVFTMTGSYYNVGTGRRLARPLPVLHRIVQFPPPFSLSRHECMYIKRTCLQARRSQTCIPF